MKQKILNFALVFCFSVIITYSQTTFSGSLINLWDVKPGDVKKGFFKVKNNKPDPVEVKIYIRDYQYNAKGEAAFGDPTQNPRSNALFIEIPSRIIVKGHDTAKVVFTVKVPENETREGSLWSVILIEEEPPESQRASGHAVRIVTQTAVQVITNLKGCKPEASIESVIIDDNKIKVTAHNTGNVFLWPTLWCEIEGRQITGNKRSLLPGCSVTFEASIIDIEPGEHNASVFIDTGEKWWRKKALLQF